MGRRKKRRRPQPDPTPSPKPTGSLNRPFAESLAHVQLPASEDVPPEPARHAYEDRVAFAQAYADVAPLPPRRSRAGGRASPASDAVEGTPEGPPSTDPEAEQRARARLDALVGGGVRFHLERDDGWVEGLQEGHPRSTLRAMRRRGWSPEAELDLHGMTVEEASRQVVRFLREGHRRGVRRVLLIHGRGAHSEGGVGVLGQRVVRTLTEGRAAPLVVAFATAPRSLGGEGALVVQLASK